MLSLITPEVLTAIGGILGTGGLVALVRVWREPSPKPGSPDAFAVAMVDLTKSVEKLVAAMQGQNDHFKDNNEMFKAMGPPVSSMGRDIEAVRLHTENLGRILDALNRRAP